MVVRFSIGISIPTLCPKLGDKSETHVLQCIDDAFYAGNVDNPIRTHLAFANKLPNDESVKERTKERKIRKNEKRKRTTRGQNCCGA